ncbi:Uncharacterised protein [Bordetella bronchiseptica]|nr:hypothetical protein L525_4548 [Bordetella bronchiseptica MBORD782]VTQ71563.1 Uncharacterised protein [Bordetella bronchiseptica]
MKSHALRGALAALCIGAALAAPLPAAAAGYPDRPISLIVGYPAGGSVDLTARLFGEALARQTGQSVVVENVGGAGGTSARNAWRAPRPTATPSCWARPTRW